MSAWANALRQAWDLILDGNPYLMNVIWVTVKVATIPTLIAGVLGLPLGVLLGLGRFRGRRLGQAVANAGLGLPPVIVGLAFVMLTLPASGALGGFELLDSLNGVYVVQTVLAFPVIVALTGSSVRAVSPGLFDQARAFGAGWIQLAGLAIREARIGIFAAFIAAVGSALSEVGAVVLAGGNIEGVDQTLASAALEQIQRGNYTTGLAIGYILLGLIIVVSAVLTFVQHRGAVAQQS